MITIKLYPSVLSVILTILLAGCCGIFEREQRYIITPIASFNQVDFNAIDTDTLVIFDVDETLIQPIDMYPANEGSPEAAQFRNYLVQTYHNVDWEKLPALC